MTNEDIGKVVDGILSEGDWHETFEYEPCFYDHTLPAKHVEEGVRKLVAQAYEESAVMMEELAKYARDHHTAAGSRELAHQATRFRALKDSLVQETVPS